VATAFGGAQTAIVGAAALMGSRAAAGPFCHVADRLAWRPGFPTVFQEVTKSY